VLQRRLALAERYQEAAAGKPARLQALSALRPFLSQRGAARTEMLAALAPACQQTKVRYNDPWRVCRSALYNR
jgi:hypothetical protein